MICKTFAPCPLYEQKTLNEEVHPQEQQVRFRFAEIAG